jgi:hypothetical protein
MRFQFPDGQVVLLDRAFVRDGTQYPAEWLRQMSPADRAAWGLVEAPEPEAPITPAPPAVPGSVSPRQARLALLAAGKLDAVEAAVAAGPQSTRIAWEYGLEIRRGDQLVVELAAALSMSDAEVDDLFRAAAAL